MTFVLKFADRDVVSHSPDRPIVRSFDVQFRGYFFPANIRHGCSKLR